MLVHLIRAPFLFVALSAERKRENKKDFPTGKKHDLCGLLWKITVSTF
jgi:hypothetical protein